MSRHNIPSSSVSPATTDPSGSVGCSSTVGSSTTFRRVDKYGLREGGLLLGDIATKPLLFVRRKLNLRGGNTASVSTTSGGGGGGASLALACLLPASHAGRGNFLFASAMLLNNSSK